MKQRRVASLAVICLLLSLASAEAAYEIGFVSGSFTPAANTYQLELAASGRHMIIQFDEPLSANTKKELSRLGISLLGYLPDRAYAATFSGMVSETELRALGVRALVPFHPEYKVHPRVTDQDFGPWSLYENGMRMFNVDVFRDVELADAAELLFKNGFEVGDHIEASHTLVVAAEPSKIMTLAVLDDVMFINEMSPPLESVNATVRTRLHVNEVQTAPYNLSGDSVTILVFDGGIVDGTHPDFSGRVTQMEAGTVAEHATHVAGTVGGNGTNSGGTNRGMAPMARIISGEYDACVPFCFYNSPNDISDDYTFARETYDVELTTNSVGANVSPNGYPCSWFGDYELTSRIVDGLVRQTGDRPLIQFWAAGNERGDPGCAISSYRCMSIPAGSKNIMTIGATTSSDGLASFTSWGPTDDGRIKPEVCATGVNVVSCSPGGGYTTMSGTSMATPAAAGTACLVLERWHSLYPGSPDPLPETIKALYINSATDLGSVGPDYSSGFGLVNALRAIQQLDAGGVMQSTLETDEQFDYEFTVPANTPTLDVSLAWSDVPAVGNVIPTLVNDLNLVLISPSAVEYLPWTLNPASPGAAAVPGIDSVNVCERVHVNTPEAGTWTLRVAGEINEGVSQTFGLAASVPLVAQWTEVSGILHPVDDPGVGIAGVVYGDEAGLSVWTNPSTGAFVFHVPQGQTYTIRARAFGYAPTSVNVNANGASVVQNIEMTPIAAQTSVTGTVVDQFGDPISGATVGVSFPNLQTPIPDMTTDAQGEFALSLPGESYVFQASFSGLLTTLEEAIPVAGSHEFTIELQDPRIRPVGPDGYGYYCYENADTGYAPEYTYTSIAPAAGGPGTLIGPGNGNDWIIEVPLPFNARYNGVVTGGLSVSADGWIGFGNVSGGTQSYANTFIPNPDLPNNCVYVFWDDLYPYHPTEGGQIAYYHDAANDRFIVEYYMVSHFAPVDFKVTAQFVLYSLGARPTRTGDSEFEIYYDRFDYDGPDTDQDATLGIENANGTDGLMVMFDGGTDPFAYPVAAHTALRYTTGPILGSGTVQGQIMAIPETDLSGATLRVGSLQFSPEANGSFSVAGVPSGNARLEVQMDGYEHLTSEQFTIPADGSVTVNMTIYRLDPPESLTGDFNSESSTIVLSWQPPDWSGIARRGNESLDELVEYKVFRQGQGPIATTSDETYTYTVSGVGVYRFWVTAVYDGGESDSSNHVQFLVTDARDAHAGIPSELYLDQNYPNPFNPTTSIGFGLPTESAITLKVYDVQGRLVTELLHSTLPAGHHRVEFDATGLGSGVFFYRLDAGGQQLFGKMMLLR
ncbi:MAG: S8 family serine peptidase [Calditrichaeota bacterium]|nr:S8 family serine peptidase [Calditrichota bacterium]MCB9366315.1 S8 family serine peptidase [Calditrichota bacterium]